jgi:hypothetical protein
MDRIFISQYGAALAMLRDTIRKYPEALWTDSRFTNPSWRIAYHALFYTHLYLSPTEESFERWSEAIPNANFMSEPIADDATPHARDAIIGYLDWIEGFVPQGLRATGWDGPSGFDWITMSRGELHLYNLRHLQHHTGQLIERLRAETGDGVDWVGRGS